MMNIEYEVTILEIDEEEFEKKIISLGASKVDEYNFRRYVYDFKPKDPGKFIRLRTNGKKTTLTTKKIFDRNIVGGTHETEVEVSDFETTNDILKDLGYENRTYQENKRKLYKYKDVEICIDKWPLIPTYAEVEGSSEKDVLEVIEELNVDKSKVTTIDVAAIYNSYGLDAEDYKVLKFDGSIIKDKS